jgi:hypothetical protein
MFNPFDTNAHVWQPIFNPFNFLHDVYASEDVSFGSSYDLVRYQQESPSHRLCLCLFSLMEPKVIDLIIAILTPNT